MSDVTKNYKTKYTIFNILSICLTLLPMLIYIIIGFAQGSVQEKLVLGLTTFVAIALSVINLLFKYSIRSTIWILLIGVYVCLDKITTLLIVIAICTIVDEFIVTPLKKKYKEKYKINKEIDARLPVNE